MAQAKITSVQEAFERFESEVVRVPKAVNDAAKKVQREVRDWLAGELDALKETFLSGSYSRRVQVVRLKDVDIIVVLLDPDGKFAESALAALEAIRRAAASCPLVRSAQIRVRSVRLTLLDYEFTVDLVAALEPDDGGDGLLLARHIPEEGLDDWTPGNPRGQREAAVKKNEQTEGIYVPSVRLVKYWLNTVWGKDKPFRSYHAESVLHDVLNEKVEYPEAMVRFFDAAYAALAPGVLTSDPGDPGTYVDQRLEGTERREAREAVARARDVARKAFDTPDVGEALDLWVEVFGSAFPAPSTSPAQVGASLAARTAGVVGPGIRVGRGRQPIESRPWRKS